MKSYSNEILNCKEFFFWITTLRTFPKEIRDIILDLYLYLDGIEEIQETEATKGILKKDKTFFYLRFGNYFSVKKRRVTSSQYEKTMTFNVSEYSHYVENSLFFQRNTHSYLKECSNYARSDGVKYLVSSTRNDFFVKPYKVIDDTIYPTIHDLAVGDIKYLTLLPFSFTLLDPEDKKDKYYYSFKKLPFKGDVIIFTEKGPQNCLQPFPVYVIRKIKSTSWTVLKEEINLL